LRLTNLAYYTNNIALINFQNVGAKSPKRDYEGEEVETCKSETSDCFFFKSYILGQLEETVVCSKVSFDSLDEKRFVFKLH